MHANWSVSTASNLLKSRESEILKSGESEILKAKKVKGLDNIMNFSQVTKVIWIIQGSIVTIKTSKIAVTLWSILSDV